MIHPYTTSRARRLSGFLVALLLTCTFLAGTLRAQGVVFGPGVQDALTAAGAADRIEVVVSFDGDGPLSTSRVVALQGLGVTGLYFKNLPIAGLLATPSQVNALAGMQGVRSIWLNEQLQYENDGSTAITGVDRLRTDRNVRTPMGVPYSGKGIGVVVNDSGIDGAHPDHKYPSHVVQNVAGQTNLQAWSSLLPFTPTENLINTDLGGGHGTHVAGIIGATGQQSGGKYEGVAPGADLIGYGSGAGLFILDAVGGFDYALTNQIRYNIRVVSNSFGSSSDIGRDFDPNDPINIATKKLADRGIIVVFSAGNSGSGEGTITGNYKKAPWVVAVAAGDKEGNLAGFSSRGVFGGGGTVAVDGETYTWVDRPTVTAPGVDVISTRASTSSLQALSATDDAEFIDPGHLPYYTTMSGTSMACPHVSGIVALMLEANPQLDVYDVRQILQETATNMPGREAWEVGAGYVNAYAAVVRALERRTDFGSTVNALRSFNSRALLELAGSEPFSIDFMTAGPTGSKKFNVAGDIARVTASAYIPENTVALVLIDPAGNRYASGITLPLISSFAVASAPGMEGEWTLTVRGIGSISGISVDPAGVTNGTALPETINGALRYLRNTGFVGLGDVEGHPSAADVRYAVSRRLVDGLAGGTYRPDDPLTRGQLAEYLVMGTGVRQFLPVDGSASFGDVSASLLPFAEAVAVRGAALKDRAQRHDGVMRADGGAFNPSGAVNRSALAYSLVQALGLQDYARGYSGALTVDYRGERVPLEDAGDVPADLRGYVQLALDLNILNAFFWLEQGPYDLQPVLKAAFRPAQVISRAEYAVVAARYVDGYRGGVVLPVGDGEATFRADVMSAAAEQVQALDAEAATDETPKAFALEQNYPNPFNPSTTIRFALPEATIDARLAIYDVLGRQVRLLVDGPLEAGQHEVTFEAGELASGTYLYRLQTPSRTFTRQMVLMK